MSKYDFDIDLSLKSSTGLLLGKIKEGSVVLEFGCATGRMTRYMKEALKCKVYIVEYDEDAYQSAILYAENGVCDDIQKFVWAEKFASIKFDVILFADVLEHLSASEKVLEEAAKLLSEEGQLLISVPNITHNDILLKAYDERFDYTPTGILDDTHLHFWGMENLKELSGKFGLILHELEATYSPTGFTEQYALEQDVQHQLLRNLLRERKCGEVYQFVATFRKQNAKTMECKLRHAAVGSCIYLDKGNDFQENELLHFEAQSTGNDSYRICYVLEDTENIKRVRFDPIEYQSCILKNLRIRQGRKQLSARYIDGIILNNDVLLQGDDPMMYIKVEEPGVPMMIMAEMILPGNRYIRELENFIQRQSQENEKLRSECQRMAAELHETKVDAGNYAVLANCKDQYSLQLKHESIESPVCSVSLTKRVVSRLKRIAKRILKREA